jgi:hypothetical protein
MYRYIFSLIVMLVSLSFSPVSFANTNVNINDAQPCAMKNMDVMCHKGKKIKLDLIRTADDKRGEIFLKINTDGAIGEHLTLYINEGKPEVLKITKEKGTFIPWNVIRKLRLATALRFSIAMKKGEPIVGSLNQSHFERMRLFGKTCI